MKSNQQPLTYIFVNKLSNQIDKAICMKKIALLTFVLFGLLISNKSYAQGVKISPIPGAPQSSAMLEVESTNKGILIPRLSLTARNLAAPVTTPDNSLLVFNTNTAGAIPFDVRPGFYYWDATLSEWIRVLDGTTIITDDQNIDSLTLTGTTLTTYIEDGTPGAIDLLSLASDANFYNTIRDSLILDSNFTDSIQSLIVNNDTFIDSLYITISDSLLLDTAWLSTIQDSINTDDQNIDSVTLAQTILSVFIENGDSASTDLIGLASDSTFYRIIRDSLLGDSTFVSSVDSLLLSDSTFVDGIIDSLLTSIYFKDSIFSYTRDSLMSDQTFFDSLFTNIRDSIIFDSEFFDSIYSSTSDSLLTDSAWLAALADSIDSDVDSAVLSGDTVLNIYENGKVVSVDISSLKDSSEWIDGSLVGLTPGNIYARKALARGDTIVINTNGYLGINESTPISRLHVTNDNDGTLDSVFVVRNNGNVGIGIATPTFRLETRGPNGDARINSIRVGRGAGDLTSNTVVGYQAFGSNTTGTLNVAIGSSALGSNTTGNRNIAVGAALGNNTTGDFNVGIGDGAMTINTTGGRNIAIGYRSLFSNTQGIGNTSIGYSSMLLADSGSYNTGFGMLTLENNTTGDYNTALGTRASEENVTGQDNTAIGSLASQDNITGSYNTSLGYAALRNNDSSDYNVGVGYEALLSLLKGNNNIALGALAGDNLTNGIQNIIIGSNIDFPNANDSNQLNIGNIIYGTGIDGSANIVSTGNIGIGTQIPTQKLDVNGQTRIRVINDTNLFDNILVARADGNIQKIDFDTLQSRLADSSEWVDGSLVGLTPGNIYARKALARGDTVAIDTNGYLAIGTDNPQSALHINGRSQNIAKVIINNTGILPNGSVVEFQSLDQNIAEVKGASFSSGNGELTFSTANSGTSIERVRIDSAGNVGVAVLNPTHLLDVNGEARIRTINDTNLVDNILVARADGNIQKIDFDTLLNRVQDQDWYNVNTGASPTSILDSIYTNGNVSIGTVVSDDRLTVNGNIRMFANDTIKVSGNNIFHNNAPGGNHLALQSNSSIALDMDQNNAATGNVVAFTQHARTDTLMVVKSEGPLGEPRVGIGTTIPTQTLHINRDTGDARIRIVADSSNTDENWNPAVTMFQDGNNIASYVGNINVGGSAFNRTVEGLPEPNGLLLLNNDNDATTTSSIAMGVNDTIAMVINNDRNIGVGTSTPTEKLEVVGNILASGTITSSDERYKRDIKTLDRALDKLMKLRGVSYFMKDEFKEKGFGDGLQIGVIAQEVEKVYPELVITNESTGYKAVNYPKFTPILIQALKEQQEEIEALKRENEALKANNTQQDEDINTLKAEINWKMVNFII